MKITGKIKVSKALIESKEKFRAVILSVVDSYNIEEPLKGYFHPKEEL